MTMIDRDSRTEAVEPRRSWRWWRRKDRSAPTSPPASAGPDEETIRIERPDFRKRRQTGRWRTATRVLVGVLLLALVAGAVWGVYFSSYVTARGVVVTGTRALGDARVEGVARVPTGTPLARVDLDAIRARVQTIASVRRVEVSRQWPHTVRIAVTERTPIAVVDQGNGLKAVDAGGVLFGGYGTRPRRLPLVKTTPGTPTEALVEAARVVDALPAAIASRVATVAVSSVDQIELVLVNGRRVLWGSAEDSDQKAEVLGVLLKQPARQIDVSVPGRPTTK